MNKAVKAQLALSGLVKLSGIRASEITLVAGLDVAYGCGMAFGAAALFSTKEGRILEVKVHPVSYPAVNGRASRFIETACTLTSV